VSAKLCGYSMLGVILPSDHPHANDEFFGARRANPAPFPPTTAPTGQTRRGRAVGDLSEFPTDDATLLAIEHALGGMLTYDRPDDAKDDGGPWLIGADYSLATLLDFLAGAAGRDPNELIQAARDESDLPEWERGRDWSAAEIVYDTRPHYSERDLIAALVAEIRRLRALAARPSAHTPDTASTDEETT
jgi:hypothetical protein